VGFLKGFECFACGSTLGKKIQGGKRGVYCFVCCVSRCNVIPLPHEMEDLDYEEILSLIGVEEGEVGRILQRLHTPGRNMSCLQRSGRNLILEHLYYRVSGEGHFAQSEEISEALDLYLTNIKQLENDKCS